MSWSRARVRGRRDENEPLIIAALRAVGAIVEQLEGKNLPDLLALWRGRTVLLEVKSPPGPRGGTSSKGQRLRPGQAEFRALAESRGVRIHVVHSVEEALAVLDVSLVSHSVNDRC